MKKTVVLLLLLLLNIKIFANIQIVTDSLFEKKNKKIEYLISYNFRINPNYENVFFNPFKSSFGNNFNVGIGININKKSYLNLSFGWIEDNYNIVFNEFVIKQYQIHLSYKPNYISLSNISYHHLLINKSNKKVYVGIGFNRDILYKHKVTSLYKDDFKTELIELNEKFSLKDNLLKFGDGAYSLEYVNLPVSLELSINKKYKIIPTIEYKYNLIGALYNGLLFNGHNYWNIGIVFKI
jgi:outer membrane protein W